MNLLTGGHFFTINPEFAKKFGVNEAIFFSELHSFITGNEKSYEDKGFISISYSSWKEIIPWLDVEDIQEIVRKLEDSSILCHIENSPTSQSQSYKINYDYILSGGEK